MHFGMMRPSAPAAMRRAMGAILCGMPTPRDGSTMTGRCESSFTTARRSVERVARVRLERADAALRKMIERLFLRHHARFIRSPLLVVLESPSALIMTGFSVWLTCSSA